MIVRALAILACALALVPRLALGQATDAVKALAGSYEMSNADRDRTCMLTLKSDSGPGGFKLELTATPAPPHSRR